MNETYVSHWWSARIPVGWSAEQTDSCVSFFAATGVGTLQISAYRKEDAVVPDDLLYDLAATEYHEETICGPIKCGEFRGFTISDTKAASFWRKWWIAEGPVMLFATYNCGIADTGIEDEGIATIMGSLKPAVSSAA